MNNQWIVVAPWKYDFKSVKSIIRMTLTDKQPFLSLNAIAPREHGFYLNVNPNVDQPSWIQVTERRIRAGVLSPKINPQMFNSYSGVASLYVDMDLRGEL